MVTGRVTITIPRLAEKFWDTKYGEVAQAGCRLDHHGCLPSFVAENVHFNSDAEIEAFYAPGGPYDELKASVVNCWPGGVDSPTPQD